MKDLGNPGGMISNWDYDKNWPLLSVVKIKDIWFSRFRSNKMKYKLTRMKLTDLTDRLFLEPKTELYAEEYENLRHVGGEMSVEGGYNNVTCKAECGTDVVDGSGPMTLMKEYFSNEDLFQLIDMQIDVKPKYIDALKIKKGDELAFVKQRVYNKDKVKVLSMASKKGSAGIKAFEFVDVSAEIQKSGITSMIMPGNKTLAFGFETMYLRGNTLDFRRVMYSRAADRENVPPAAIISGLEERRSVWESLAGCSRLLPSLTGILEDECDLNKLEDALDDIIDGDYQPPEPGPVASFMDLLDVSTASKELLEALHLLVCALQALPENVPAALAKCDVETLDGIMGIMDHLKLYKPRVIRRWVCIQEEEKDELNKEEPWSLPESMLRPLMEKEELNWVGSFLSSERCREIDPNYKSGPGAELEALYISVRGIRLMQP